MSHEQHHLLGDNANHPNVNISGELKGDVLWHNGSGWVLVSRVVSTDKFLKLSGEEVLWAATGAAGSQSLFETISADSGTSPVADTTTDTLNIAGGTAIKTAGDSANDRVSISFSISGEVAGDIPYKTTTTWTRRSAGSQNQFLRQGASNVPEWANVVSGEKLKISNTDPIADHLINKIAAGSNVTITKSNSVSGELLTIASTGGGGGGTITVQEGDTVVGGGAFDTLDFTANDFAITESPSQEANISIDYTNGQSASPSVKGFLTASDYINFSNFYGNHINLSGEHVTNGNTHDHSGGDGAQINHTALSNIGSNSHAVLDSHLTLTTTHGVSGEIVGTTHIQTLTNKTLTTPTIGSFTNAGHNHTNAANGGQIVSGETGRSKVTGNDTTLGYISGKLTAGSGIVLTINNAGANESLDIATSGGGAATITVQENDVTLGSGSFNTVDFNGNDFAVTELPSGEANVSIDYTNAQSASPSTKGFLTAANYTTFADFSGNHTKLSGEHVTNGNTHDHSGGDGAQINHTTLSNIGSNTHSDIDIHIAAISAHGVSGDVVGTASVQTLSSKILLIPTIADLTNMNHAHSSIATGGQVSHLNLTNIGSNAHSILDAHLTYTTTHGVSGEIVGTTSTQTLTNKTLTTPTIGSFTNSTHNHQNAAGGGQIISGENGRTRVSGNDLTLGYLNGKLVAGTNITLTENSDGGDETLTIASTGGAGTQNLFETISADSGTSAVADSTTDTLNIAGGVAIKTAGDSANDRVTISLSVSGEVAGDTLYRTASTWTRLPSGEVNQFYQQGASSVPRWKAIQQTANIGIVIDGGGSAIITGKKGNIVIPWNCTIDSATLLADQTGSIVVDVWCDSYANYPPSGEDSICAAAKPTISASNKAQDTTLTGWSTSLLKGQVLGFNVDSVATVTRVSVNLGVTKT